MQNRLATAILMSLGGAIDHMETKGSISEETASRLLEKIGEYTERLLNGEVVNTEGAYVDMQLSGTNEACVSYNHLAATFLKADNNVQFETQGYKE